jgi:hypothetical protein
MGSPIGTGRVAEHAPQKGVLAKVGRRLVRTRQHQSGTAASTFRLRDGPLSPY